MELSILRLLLFMVVLVGSLIYYYNKLLSVHEGEHKTFAMMKQVLYLLVLGGIISIFSSTESIDLKVMLLVVMVSFVNIFNINSSTKKCNYPSLYKLKLYIKSTIFVIVLSLLMYYSNKGEGLFSFLYTEDPIIGPPPTKTIDINLWKSGAASQCPDPNKLDATEYDKAIAVLPATAKPGLVSRALCEEVERRKGLDTQGK